MSHIKYFKVGEGHSAPLLPPPPIHPQPLGTQGGLTTKPRGPGRGTGPGWGLDPWPLPPLAQSPHCPPPPSWALTCDGEDREEDGYQRLDAEAHLGGQLLSFCLIYTTWLIIIFSTHTFNSDFMPEPPRNSQALDQFPNSSHPILQPASWPLNVMQLCEWFPNSVYLNLNQIKIFYFPCSPPSTSTLLNIQLSFS